MNMTPSKSSLDRLPKQLSERWEAERERFEAALRAEETVPREALTVAISLDGVMVPMKDGRRAQKRQDAKDARQAHPRSGGLPRSGLWHVEVSMTRRENDCPPCGSRACRRSTRPR